MRIICPPTKSTPRLSPLVATSAIEAIISRTLIENTGTRQRRNLMFVLSGMSLMSFMAGSLQHEFRRALLAKPARDPQARHRDRGEHRGDDADDQHDRETADRTGAEHEHDHGRNRIGDVRVEDGAAGFLVAKLHRLDDAAPP